MKIFKCFYEQKKKILQGFFCNLISPNHYFLLCAPLPFHLSKASSLLTKASGYLVVIAPGAVWLADCGRQLFGEPVTAVTEVGRPCADGVISSEHTSVRWRIGHTA